MAAVLLGSIFAMGGCRGQAVDEPTAGASTEDIEAFIEDNPQYGDSTSSQPSANSSQTANRAKTTSDSQPLDLGN